MRGIGEQEVLDERETLGANAAPAGGLVVERERHGALAADPAGHGALPGDGKARLFSEDASREMWTPQVLMPISPYPAPIAEATPQFSAYALGWDVRDYRGVKILEHGGAVFGVQTIVVLIPDRQVGFSIQINSEDSVVLLGLQYELLDHYLGAPKRDWVAGFSEFRQAKVARGLAALNATEREARSPRARRWRRSGYAGQYADPWYGPIDVRLEGGQLRIDFKQTPNMAGTLEHWQFDTFRTKWDDRTIEPAYVTFSLDAEGKVDRIKLKAVSPLADFSYDYQDLLLTPVP